MLSARSFCSFSFSPFLAFPFFSFFFRKIIGRCVRFRNYALIRFAEISIVRTRSCVQKISGFTARGIHGESFYTFRNRGFLNNVLTVLISRRSTRPIPGGRKRADDFISKSHHSGRVSFSNRVTALIRRTDVKHARLIQRKS